jgi:hypothetical protein
MVVWKAVSNTATCGTSASSFRATAMPASAGGLCSGASGTSRSITATTSSSITVARSNSPAPCTTRCPTASSRPSSTESMIRRSAASWSGASPPGSPIRSMSPFDTVSSPSNNRYFTDDEPVFSTRILIGRPPGSR